MKNAPITCLSLFLVAGPARVDALQLDPGSMLVPNSPAIERVHEGHAGAAPASGVVNAVDTAQRKVNVSHGSIKQLGWPAMTMDFPVGQEVDLSTIKAGMKVNFSLVRDGNGAWTVDTMKPSAK